MVILGCYMHPSTTACLDGLCIGTAIYTVAGYPIGVGGNKVKLNVKVVEAVSVNRDGMHIPRCEDRCLKALYRT